MKYLKDNVFITAPSDSIQSKGDKIRLENAIKNFNDMGITVKLGTTVTLENKYTEDEYKLKASELVDVLLDDSIDTIISANGGDTQFQIIKYIDFDIIKKHPNKKIFQGFSDNSILTFLLETMSNWNTFYAPCFPTFGYEKWDQTIKDNLELLKGHIIEQYSQEFFETKSYKKIEGKELYGYNLDTLSSVTELTGLNDFTVSGTLLGGCLDVLRDLPKSQYDNMQEYNKKHKNIIWFIENCAMNIEQLSKTLEIMEKSHWFDNVCCFMIGRGKITLNEEFSKEQNKLLLNIFSKYNVPIIVNCNLGHVRPFNTFITGATAKVEYFNNKYTITYENIE